MEWTFKCKRSYRDLIDQSLGGNCANKHCARKNTLRQLRNQCRTEFVVSSLSHRSFRSACLFRMHQTVLVCTVQHQPGHLNQLFDTPNVCLSTRCAWLWNSSSLDELLLLRSIESTHRHLFEMKLGLPPAFHNQY